MIHKLLPTLLLLGSLRLSAAPPQAQAGETASFRGPVEIEIADDFARGAARVLYRFRRNGIEQSALHREGVRLPPVACGSTMDLELAGHDDRLEVTRVSAAGPQASDPDCAPTGDQRLAIIVATFPGVPPPNAPPAHLARLAFAGDGPSLATWYGEKSYGRVSFTGSVFGPFALDRSYGCNETAAMRAAAIRVAGTAIDWRQFQRFLLVLPSTSSCRGVARSSLGCLDLQIPDGTHRASWIWLTAGGNDESWLDLLIHEMGHSLGLGHAKLLRFPGDSLGPDDFRAVPVEYGDPTSTMGRGQFGDFPASQKVALGWIDPDESIRSVEEDSTHLLTSARSPAGLRALRVRRRVGMEEWLWIETRGPEGLLVRRETPSSGSNTHLLDLTPSSLDEARSDGGQSSENYSWLPPGTSWADRHSGLNITAGDAQEDGIEVTIRYGEPCARVEIGELSLRAEEQEITIPVSVGESCEWSAESGRSWLRVFPEDGSLKVVADRSEDGFHRSGIVTAGRQAIRVNQRGPEHRMELLQASPPGPGIPTRAAVPMLFHLRDLNGLDDMAALRIRIEFPGNPSLAACHFRYSSSRRVVEVSDDGESYRDSETASRGVSGVCQVEALLYRVDMTTVILRAILTLESEPGDEMSIALRPEDSRGETGDWLEAGRYQTGGACQAVPAADYFFYLPGAAYQQNLSIRATSSDCPWTAATTGGWLRIWQFTGSGPTALRFDVDANSEPQTREGSIEINGVRVRIVQTGNGEVLPTFVTLRPEETLVSRLAGVGVVAFNYGLGELIPAESQDDWLKVWRVERVGDRSEVLFYWEDNPEPLPRIGHLLLGGKRFTVLQEAASPEVAPEAPQEN